jgi:hypothetical protein
LSQQARSLLAESRKRIDRITALRDEIRCDGTASAFCTTD